MNTQPNSDFDPGQLLHALREQRPLVQCITNYVAANIAANVMLAAGASPAMVHAREESGEFAALSKAVTINIGTLSPLSVEGMLSAVASANSHNIPWVFDPVAHFATRFRQEVTRDLLAAKPTIIRANASEIIALHGMATQGSGADSGDSVDHAVEPAKRLAQQLGCIVTVTGPRDFVTDGVQSVWIDGGSPTMPKITALGCALTCLVGAFAGSHPNAFEASIAALSLFAVCGAKAQDLSEGPGSFQPVFLDQLSLITPDQFNRSAKVSQA